MSSVNGTSSVSSALGVTGKGIGGLATGLNTDELVAALTSGTKSKIAKQGQQKTLLNWKMTAYRSMATALNAFQAKFLKTGSTAASNTNILSDKFFNTYKASSSSDKVSVSTNSQSVTGNFTIDEITQLATSDSFKSKGKMSTTLSMDINKDSKLSSDFTGQTLKLEVGTFSVKSIKLDDLNEHLADNGDGTYSIKDFDAFKTDLEAILNKAYGSKDKLIEVGTDTSGNIKLDSSSARVTVNTTNDMLGLTAGDSSRVSPSTKIGQLAAFSNVQGDVLTFNINGAEISVKKTDTIDALLKAVNGSTANVRMEYDQYKDEFTLTSKVTGVESKIDMRDVHGNLLNEIFGAQGGSGVGTDILTTGTSTTIDFDFINKIGSMTDAERKTLGSKLSGMSFDLTINGVTKSVKVDTLMGIDSKRLAAGTYTADEVYNAINKGIQSAFYNSGVKFSSENGKTVISSSKSEAFSVSAKSDFAGLLGMDAGTNYGNTINDYGYNRTIDSNAGYIDPKTLGLTQENPSTTFEMTINGVTKSITVSLDERDPTEEEKAAEGFDPEKKLYSDFNAEVFTPRLNAAVKQAFGNDAVTFKGDYTYSYETIEDIEGYEGAEFRFDEEAFKANPDLDIYGVYKDGTQIGTITKDLGDGQYVLKKADGNLTLVDKDGNLLFQNGNKIAKEVTGIHLTLNTADAGKVATKAVTLGAGFDKLGFNEGASNADNSNGVKFADIANGENMTGGTLTVNGATVTYTKDDTLNSFLEKMNAALGDTGTAVIKDGKLSINSASGSVEITDTGSMLKDIFGVNNMQDGKNVFKTADQSYGSNYTEFQNALYTIDGRTFESTSNNVSYNNVNLTLNDTTLKTDGTHEAIKIGVQADPDDVIKRIQEWMDDYNALVYTLNTAINEGKNRDYTPLTDEQKADMTDDQIKTWEAQAKKGILRGDNTLRQILTDMRSTFFDRVESAGISLYDIGIVTKSGLSDPNQAGQLEFDKNITGGGESRLREMLLTNPDQVRMLFTDPDNGIGAKLNNIITQAASTSSINRGTLVRIAGTEIQTGDNTSQLGNKISALDKYIAALKTRLEAQHNRYWKQFSSLETSVQKMNTQSSWLQSQ